MKQSNHAGGAGGRGGLLSSKTPAAAALLFLFSLAAPVFILTAGPGCSGGSERGISLLLLGWVSPLVEGGSLSWYANPLVLLALFLGRWGQGLRADVRGVLLTTIVLAIWALQLDSFRLESMTRGLNSECTIGKYGAGFYLWNLAVLTASVYSIIPTVTWMVRCAKSWSAKTKKIVGGTAISLLPAPVFAVKDTTILERISVGFSSVDEEVTTTLCAMAVVAAGISLSLYAQYMTNWSTRAKIFSFPALVVAGLFASFLSLLAFTPLISVLAFYARGITYILIDNPRVVL